MSPCQCQMSTCFNCLFVLEPLCRSASPQWLHTSFSPSDRVDRVSSLESVRNKWRDWRQVRPCLPFRRTNVYSRTSAMISVIVIVILTQNCMAHFFAPFQIANCIRHMFRSFCNALGGCFVHRHQGVGLFFQSPTHIMQPGQMCLDILEGKQLLMEAHDGMMAVRKKHRHQKLASVPIFWWFTRLRLPWLLPWLLSFMTSTCASASLSAFGRNGSVTLIVLIVMRLRLLGVMLLIIARIIGVVEVVVTPASLSSV